MSNSDRLTKRMIKALKNLDYECRYEDGRHPDDEKIHIVSGKIGPGVGAKTLSDLLEMGLVSKGTNKYFGTPGYRITEAGIEALARHW